MTPCLPVSLSPCLPLVNSFRQLIHLKIKDQILAVIQPLWIATDLLPSLFQKSHRTAAGQKFLRVDVTWLMATPSPPSPSEKLLRHREGKSQPKQVVYGAVVRVRGRASDILCIALYLSCSPSPFSPSSSHGATKCSNQRRSSRTPASVTAMIGPCAAADRQVTPTADIGSRLNDQAEIGQSIGLLRA